jgi:hypothetical protein
VAIGLLLAIIALPTVRYTFSEQFDLALEQDSIPWVRALDARHSRSEEPRLAATAAANPDDYLIQIGLATTMADAIDMRSRYSSAAETSASEGRVLTVLARIAAQYPQDPGAFAHFVRYMTANRVQILRTEIGSAPGIGTEMRSIPARHSDVKLMEWALQRGMRLDPDNAFWPTMLATVYFAADRDQEAIAALTTASRDKRWDAYIYEQVLGQWRLFAATYGDSGATQKIGPLSLVAFPHLREIRHMAEMARWKADQEEAQGRPVEAVRIRRNIAWIGILIRDSTQWAYEALLGTDLVLLSAVSSDPRININALGSEQAWQRASNPFFNLLTRLHESADAAWVHSEAATSLHLRHQISEARNDTSYPGIPPGIPLVALFGNWMAGVCLLQQAMTLAAAGLLAVLAGRMGRGLTIGRLGYGAVLSGALVLFIATVQVMRTGIASPRIAAVFTISSTVLLLFLMELAARAAAAVTSRSRYQLSSAERRWTNRTTAIMLALVFSSGAVALYVICPWLSSMHPVAVLLSGLVTSARQATALDALELALLMAALPLAIVLVSGLWGLARRVSPLSAVAVGLRRSLLPALACLGFAYLLLLSRTLELDSSASRAIHDAAENDLAWVLTHTAPNQAEP